MYSPQALKSRTPASSLSRGTCSPGGAVRPILPSSPKPIRYPPLPLIETTYTASTTYQTHTDLAPLFDSNSDLDDVWVPASPDYNMNMSDTEIEESEEDFTGGQSPQLVSPMTYPWFKPLDDRALPWQLQQLRPKPFCRQHLAKGFEVWRDENDVTRFDKTHGFIERASVLTPFTTSQRGTHHFIDPPCCSPLSFVHACSGVNMIRGPINLNCNGYALPAHNEAGEKTDFYDKFPAECHESPQGGAPTTNHTFTIFKKVCTVFDALCLVSEFLSPVERHLIGSTWNLHDDTGLVPHWDILSDGCTGKLLTRWRTNYDLTNLVTRHMLIKVMIRRLTKGLKNEYEMNRLETQRSPPSIQETPKFESEDSRIPSSPEEAVMVAEHIRDCTKYRMAYVMCGQYKLEPTLLVRNRFETEDMRIRLRVDLHAIDNNPTWSTVRAVLLHVVPDALDQNVRPPRYTYQERICKTKGMCLHSLQQEAKYWGKKLYEATPTWIELTHTGKRV